MGKRSVKENKNIYQLLREEKNLSRDAADELIPGISADRIEKIESGKSLPHPEEILLMSEAYEYPSLRNYYCSHECPIGRRDIPPIPERTLAELALEVLDSLNELERKKDRLVEITVDGLVSRDEKDDFQAIERELKKLSLTAQALGLWIERALLEGKMEK